MSSERRAATVSGLPTMAKRPATTSSQPFTLVTKLGPPRSTLGRDRAVK